MAAEPPPSIPPGLRSATGTGPADRRRRHAALTPMVKSAPSSKTTRSTVPSRRGPDACPAPRAQRAGTHGDDCRERRKRMSKTDALRLQDVRGGDRLIGGCRGLASDPALWYRRMLEGLYLLFGVIQAAGGEGWWDRPLRRRETVSAYSVSGDPGPDEAFRAYH